MIEKILDLVKEKLPPKALAAILGVGAEVYLYLESAEAQCSTSLTAAQAAIALMIIALMFVKFQQPKE